MLARIEGKEKFSRAKTTLLKAQKAATLGFKSYKAETAFRHMGALDKLRHLQMSDGSRARTPRPPPAAALARGHRRPPARAFTLNFEGLQTDRPRPWSSAAAASEYDELRLTAARRAQRRAPADAGAAAAAVATAAATPGSSRAPSAVARARLAASARAASPPLSADPMASSKRVIERARARARAARRRGRARRRDDDELGADDAALSRVRSNKVISGVELELNRQEGREAAMTARRDEHMRWVWLSMTAGERQEDRGALGRQDRRRERAAAARPRARGRARDDRRRAPRVRRGRAAAARRGVVPGGGRPRGRRARGRRGGRARCAPPPSEMMRASMSELMHGEAVDPIDALVTQLSEQHLQLGCYATHFEEGLPDRAALRGIEAHGGSSEKGALEDVWRKQWRDMPIRDRKRHARQLRVKGHVPQPPPRAPAPARARRPPPRPSSTRTRRSRPRRETTRPPPRSTRPRATTARPTASTPRRRPRQCRPPRSGRGRRARAKRAGDRRAARRRPARHRRRRR